MIHALTLSFRSNVGNRAMWAEFEGGEKPPKQMQIKKSRMKRNFLGASYPRFQNGLMNIP